MASSDWYTHAASLHAAGNTDAAIAVVLQAIKQAPADPNVLMPAASALGALAQTDRALFYAQRAVELAQSNPVAWRCVHDLLWNAGRYAEMIASATRAVVACPQSSGLWLDLAAPYLDIGESDQSLAAIQEAIAREPLGWIAAQAQLMAMNYLWPPDPAAMKAALLHAATCAALAAQQLPITPLPASPAPLSPLSPGLPGTKPLLLFVSPDCFIHSVAFFLLPLLEHADPARARVHIIHTGPKRDAVTAQIQAACRRLGGDLHESAPDAIFGPINAITAAHGPIDIAIDLAGLTPRNSINCFARTIAPRHASYLGYPNSTGQPAIGVRLVDAITDPPGGSTDGLGPERLIRLPGCFLCYQPPHNTPPVAPAPPAARARDGNSGGVTFGSFNNACKLNSATLDLWSRVLASVPGSALLLKCATIKDKASLALLRKRIDRAFTARSVDPRRVELVLSVKDVAANLALYSRIDIALDTLGYTGTTTTCEALYMGVPVLTCAPPQALHAGRVSASLIACAGLPELITTSTDEFVARAAALAADRQQRALYRATLRQRISSSPLCDAPAFAAKWFDAVLSDQTWAGL